MATTVPQNRSLIFSYIQNLVKCRYCQAAKDLYCATSSSGFAAFWDSPCSLPSFTYCAESGINCQSFQSCWVSISVLTLIYLERVGRVGLGQAVR